MRHEICDTVSLQHSRVEILPGDLGIRVPVRVARTGIQAYPPQHPVTRELVSLGVVRDGQPSRLYRDPKEVLAAGYLTSLRSSPLTVGHPPGGVNSSNWRQLSVGHVEAVTRTTAGDNSADGAGETFIEATAVIHDGDTVRRVLGKELRDGETQLTELSCGYGFELDPHPGIAHDGLRYDAAIKSPRNNHVALLETGRARAGAGARVLLDQKEQAAMDQLDQMQRLLDERLPKPAPAPAPEVVTKADHESALKALTDAKDAEIKALTEERDALKKAASDRDLADAVSATKHYLKKDFDVTGKSAVELKRAAMGKTSAELADSEVPGAWKIFTESKAAEASRTQYFDPKQKVEDSQEVTDALEAARLRQRENNKKLFDSSYG